MKIDILKWLVLVLGVSEGVKQAGAEPQKGVATPKQRDVVPLFYTKTARHLEAHDGNTTLGEHPEFSAIYPTSTQFDVTLNPQALQLLELGIQSNNVTDVDADDFSVFPIVEEAGTKSSKRHSFKAKSKSTTKRTTEGRHLRGSDQDAEYTTFTLESENGGTAVLSVGPNGISAIIREMGEEGVSGQTFIVSPADTAIDNLAHVVTLLSKEDEQTISELDKSDHEKHVAEKAKDESTAVARTEEGHHRALAQSTLAARKTFRLRINYDNEAVAALKAANKNPKLTTQQILNNNAALQLAQLQLVLQNSGVDYNIVLEKAVHVDREMTHDSYSDLNALSTMDRGSAHFAVLITGSNQYCGRSYLPGKTTGFSPEAFKQRLSSVVSLICSVTNWSFVHEWGHAANADHNIGNALLRALFPYSYGYMSDDRSKGTIMSYIANTIYRYATYSQTKSYQGMAVGDEKTNNARTIAESLYDYANLFFSGSQSTPTPAPTGVNVKTSAPSMIQPTPFPTTKKPSTRHPTKHPTKQPTKPAIVTTKHPTFAPTKPPTIDQTPTLLDNQYVRFTIHPTKTQSMLSINLVPNRLVRISNTGIVVLNTANSNKPVDSSNLILAPNYKTLLASMKLTAGSNTRLQIGNIDGYVVISLVPQKQVTKTIHGKKKKIWVDGKPQPLVQIKETKGSFMNPTVSFSGLALNTDVTAGAISKAPGTKRRLDEVPYGDLTDEERRDVIKELASSPYAMLHVLNIGSDSAVKEMLADDETEHVEFLKQLFASASNDNIAELFKVLPPEAQKENIKYIDEARYAKLATYTGLEEVIPHGHHKRV